MMPLANNASSSGCGATTITWAKLVSTATITSSADRRTFTKVDRNNVVPNARATKPTIQRISEKGIVRSGHGTTQEASRGCQRSAYTLERKRFHTLLRIQSAAKNTCAGRYLGSDT